MRVSDSFFAYGPQVCVVQPWIGATSRYALCIYLVCVALVYLCLTLGVHPKGGVLAAAVLCGRVLPLHENPIAPLSSGEYEESGSGSGSSSGGESDSEYSEYSDASEDVGGSGRTVCVSAWRPTHVKVSCALAVPSGL